MLYKSEDHLANSLEQSLGYIQMLRTRLLMQIRVIAPPCRQPYQTQPMQGHPFFRDQATQLPHES
jgi:hypothetical protein